MEAVDLLPFERGLDADVEAAVSLRGGEPRGAHRGHEPALIAETDLRAAHRGDGVGGPEPTPIDVGEDRVQGFERPGHLQVSELRAEALAHRRDGLHGAPSASRAYAASGRCSTTAARRDGVGLTQRRSGGDAALASYKPGQACVIRTGGPLTTPLGGEYSASATGELRGRFATRLAAQADG